MSCTKRGEKMKYPFKEVVFDGGAVIEHKKKELIA